MDWTDKNVNVFTSALVADFAKQVRAGVECLSGDCHTRCFSLKRDIVDLRNYADLPLVGRCFADVVRCPPPNTKVSSVQYSLFVTYTVKNTPWEWIISAKCPSSESLIITQALHFRMTGVSNKQSLIFTRCGLILL